MTSLTLTAGPHAFGDGSHPTTRGVLELLAGIDADAFCPTRALDIGAGSGILSIAIARQFGCPVIATDIEKQAVATIVQNAVANGAGDRVAALHADGFDHPEIAARGPYHLITMNILAEPLMRLAADAVAHLAPEGVLILSGMLVWQEAEIRQAYEVLGCECTARAQMGDWVTLAMQLVD